MRAEILEISGTTENCIKIYHSLIRMANLVNYDTGDDAPCRAQIVGAFAPDVYRAIIVVVGDANAGQNPRLVYIETAAVGKKNFEHGVPPANELRSRQGLVIRKIESISKR